MIAPCDAKAARYAVEHWHYSECMPIGKAATFGIWEQSEFIGCVIFSRGASPNLGRPFGLGQTECCELTRIAMASHERPVTAYVSAAVTLLRSSSPGLRCVVSFADPAQGHIGTVYQAGNWVYTGASSLSDEVYYKGKWLHNRMLRPTGFGTVPEVARLTTSEQADLPKRRRPGKHRYVLPLDKQIRRRVLKLAQPYPQHLAVEGSTVIRSSHQTRGDGATPSDRSIAS